MKDWSEAILEFVNSLGNEAALKDIYATLERFFPLDGQNLRATRHGGRRAFQHEVRSFVSNLLELGELERVVRGRYRVTAKGLKRLEEWMARSDRQLHEPRATYVASPPRLYVMDVEVEALDEGGFMAVCGAIQGCRAEGETVAEVLENIEDVARVLLELRKEDKLPFPTGLKAYEPSKPLRADLLVTVSD